MKTAEARNAASRRGPKGGSRLDSVRVACMVAAAGLAAWPVQARAFELFGVHLWGDAAPEEPLAPDAQPYSIAVTVAGADEDFADRVRAYSLLYAERDEPPPPSTAAFLSRIRAEYGRLVAGLYSEGYYGPSIVITVDGRDPAGLEPDAALPKPAAVAIAVDPGPRFAFGEVAISGRAPPAVAEDDRPERSIEELGLIAGGVARSTIVLQSERVLVDAWREQGHPKARIASREATADHPSSTLDVAVAVEAGPAAVYGPIDVTGTRAMDPDFVAFMTGIQPGEPYDPDDITKAAKNLRRLQVFSSQRIVEADAVTPEGTLPLTVAVAERPMRVFGAGGSYSTVDGAGVEGYWEHRNLFGKAEKLRVEGRVGGIDSVDPLDFSYAVGATFTKPGVITPLTDLVAEIGARREPLDSYTDTTVRARVGLAHEFYEGLSGKVAINVEATKIEDSPRDGEYLLVSLPAELTWNTRDNDLNPTEGFTLTGRLEPFQELQFGNTGVISELEATGYVSLTGDDSFVLAARAAVGSIVGAPSDELPTSRLFLVGGGGSIRGYGYRNVGPRIGDEVVGGRSYVEASLEVRAKVTESIGIVPFIDAGNAFDASFPDFSEDLKFGAGIGLRYATGLGPIRLDAAVPLNPDDGDPSFAVYVGLGQAF